IYLGHDIVANFVYLEPGATYPALRLLVIAAMIVIFSTGLYQLVEVPGKGILRRMLAASERLLFSPRASEPSVPPLRV
ncbi:MAG: hypothetical protein JO163_11755, partial [Methylobacteriaceae bacterium]|nr:hypothetical protein [Methylobacteriaceae bacterium]